MIVDNLSTLKINKMTQEQYDRELAADNLSTTELYLTPAPENVDSILEQGTSVHSAGTWTWRKWRSGLYEGWGSFRPTISGSGAILGGYGCYGSLSFPTVFIQAPIVTYSVYGNTGYEFCGKSNVGTGSFTWYALSNSAYTTGNTVHLHVTVKGKWK